MSRVNRELKFPHNRIRIRALSQQNITTQFKNSANIMNLHQDAIGSSEHQFCTTLSHENAMHMCSRSK